MTVLSFDGALGLLAIAAALLWRLSHLSRSEGTIPGASRARSERTTSPCPTMRPAGDVRAVQEAVLTEDYESCAGYLPGECWGRETSIKVVSNFASTIPDMKFEIREVLVAGDRGIVGSEVTGTPSGELFGVPHSGNSFRIMAVDIQTIRDGKIAKTYHMENWLSAIGQLRAK
jgi:ketosteroid isomerase-like protein